MSPPEFLTRHIVQKNYKYFILGKNDNRHKNLFFDFLVQNYFKNNFLKNEKNFRKIMTHTNNFLIDLNEVDFYGSNPNLYNLSLGSVIIYGYGGCESNNGILALRLSKIFNNIQTFSLFDKTKNSSPHTLVRIKYKNSNFYLDIYGNKGNFAYTLENSDINSLLGLDIFDPNNYNGLLKILFFNDGYDLKKFTLLEYFKSFLIKSDLKLLPINNFTIKKNKLLILRVKNQKLKNEQLIKLYIDARFDHMNGEIDKALKKYQIISDSTCEQSFCLISKLLIKQSEMSVFN